MASPVSRIQESRARGVVLVHLLLDHDATTPVLARERLRGWSRARGWTSELWLEKPWLEVRSWGQTLQLPRFFRRQSVCRRWIIEEPSFH